MRGKRRTGMDTGDIVRDSIGEDSKCMWQMVPSELPRDMVPMCLELWADGSGRLYLFQFITEDRKAKWWERIIGVTRFNQNQQ